jgi:acyl-[acyl-carrier-protein]-phospholipid O-acyltransferase/long-chain-fatty-acid--[acyl-carrier-protein] ligase
MELLVRLGGSAFKLAALALVAVVMGAGVQAVFGTTTLVVVASLIGVAAAFALLPAGLSFGALSLIFNKPLVLGVSVAAVAAGYLYDMPDLMWRAAVFGGVYALLAFAPASWLQAVFGPLLRGAVRALFRMEVQGLEHYKAAVARGERVLLAPNHPSFLDPLMLAVAIPAPLTFAMNARTAEKPMFKFVVRLMSPFATVHKVDLMSAMALKNLVALAKEGRPVVIFPEGRVSITGTLMMVQEGAMMVAQRADARLLAVRIDGTEYSHASHMGGKLKQRLLPKIRLTVMPPAAFDTAAKASGGRKRGGEQLYTEMATMMFASTNIDQTLFDALRDGYHRNGPGHVVVEDALGTKLTYANLMTGAVVLGRKLAKLTAPGDAVGLMLPNSAGVVVSFFALQYTGRVAAMLNFTVGPAAAVASCKARGVTQVFTSRLFLEQAAAKRNPNPQNIVNALVEAGIRVHYLDDVRAGISAFDKLWGLVGAWWAANFGVRQPNPTDEAVVIFTSGSEGPPKGVGLSHRNLLANRAQAKAIIDFNPSDKVLNALPMFHSFGLTVGTLLPVLEGIPTFMYPNPLDYKLIPMLAYDINATIIFGTDVFLSGYARQAHPYHFKTLRMAFAGAEKVKDETRRIWADRFGVRILEGYGATECAPVIAANTPMNPKAGTVGKLVPGMTYELRPVPGLARGGRLFVKGPNVMRGYYKVDNPGVLQPPPGGWYDTGDLVYLDDEGFIVFIGREKRSIKSAGEMVPLGFGEELASRVWPAFRHAASFTADAKKGQVSVLVTENPNATVAELAAAAQNEKAPALFVPRHIVHVAQLPLLGTGKVDYTRLDALVADEMAKRAAPAQATATDDGDDA